MTNALDELRRRAALGTPEAAAASEAEGRAAGRLKNVAPWFRYLKISGTLKSIEQGRITDFATFANFVLTNTGDIEENPGYNAARDELPDHVIEVKFPNPDKGIQRQWEPTVLMVESARAIDPNVGDVFSLVGRRVSLALTVEFIENRDGTPALDNKGYQRETWYYKVTSLGSGSAPAAAPDAANVAALASRLVGESADIKTPFVLKAMQADPAIKDAALQKLVVDGKFVAHAQAENLLAEAEGVLYDPTANTL